MDNSVCGKQSESKTEFTEEEAMEYLSNDVCIICIFLWNLCIYDVKIEYLCDSAT